MVSLVFRIVVTAFHTVVKIVDGRKTRVTARTLGGVIASLINFIQVVFFLCGDLFDISWHTSCVKGVVPR